MPMSTTRSAWENKFREPSVNELFEHYSNKQVAAVAEAARARLTEFANVKESIQWLGMPWRWTLVYNCDFDTTRAWAYLVLDPAKVQLCLPITTAMVQTLPLRRLKKNIRDGIVYSKVVAGTYWPTWEVPSKTSLDDLIDLAARKHKYIHLGSETVAGLS